MEEFGATAETRPALYDAVFRAVHDSVLRGGALQGALFWRYYAAGQQAPLDEGGGPGMFAVTMRDPTWLQIVRFGGDMAAAGGARLGGCVHAGPVARMNQPCPPGCVMIRMRLPCSSAA